MFRITTEDNSELIVLNHRYLKELTRLPDDVLSMKDAIEPNLLAHYTFLTAPHPVTQHALRSDLTPGLPRLMPHIASEATYALKQNFPQDQDDWVEVTAFQSMLNTVAQVSARIFVGSEICRDPRWIECSQKMALNAFNTLYAMKKYHSLLHPLVYRFIPEAKALNQARFEGMSILREAAAKREELHEKDEEDYFMSWVIKKNPKLAKDFAAQFDLQLEISAAAVHNTASALTHVLYDLAANPEYVQILRAEIKEALAESGGYNKECMAKMVKTDSFVKESQRLHPPSVTTFRRRVMKPFTLSDGAVIPKGVIIEVDGSVRYLDPSLWENPHDFDGLRFFRLREKTQEKGNHQYVSSNIDWVIWGQGKHACPGKFCQTSYASS
jgi:cytochrome P450